jgi:hypothetical protein
VCTEQNTAKFCHVAYGLQFCLYRRHFSCRYLKLILSSSVCNLQIFHLPQHWTLISNFFLIAWKYLLIQFISNVNKTRCRHLPFPNTSVWPGSYCLPVRKFVFQIRSIHVRPVSDISRKTTLLNYSRRTPHSLTEVNTTYLTYRHWGPYSLTKHTEHNIPPWFTPNTIFFNYLPKTKLSVSNHIRGISRVALKITYAIFS